MKNVLTAITSFLICFLMFLAIIFYPLFIENSKEQTTLKNQASIAYSPLSDTEKLGIKITIEGCTINFLMTIMPKHKTIKIGCLSNKNNSSKQKEYKHQINFSLKGFENTVNFLGGVEIETPYGLPSPAKTNAIIAKDEKLFVYGASLGVLLCDEADLSAERINYYCYALGEVCLKFLKNGNTTLYKHLKNNSQTDISYTDYYDNYKYLKATIKSVSLDA